MQHRRYPFLQREPSATVSRHLLKAKSKQIGAPSGVVAVPPAFLISFGILCSNFDLVLPALTL